MKQLMLAAVAATLVFASAAQAAAPAKADQAAMPMAMMSPEDCKKAMDACADQACKDALMKDHGCKAE